jgi:hypothetical protein
VEHLLDDLIVRDVITEDMQLAGQGAEAQHKVFNRLTSLERDVAELKSRGVVFLDPVSAYVHLLNPFPGFTCRGLHR